MLENILNFEERHSKVRYWVVLIIFISVIFIFIDMCFIHFINWQKFGHYPEKEYEQLEQEILSADDIFSEEFKSKFIVKTGYNSKDINDVKVMVSDENVDVYVIVTNYRLPNQKIKDIERVTKSKTQMIIKHILELIVLLLLINIFCVSAIEFVYFILLIISRLKEYKKE